MTFDGDQSFTLPQVAAIAGVECYRETRVTITSAIG